MGEWGIKVTLDELVCTGSVVKERKYHGVWNKEKRTASHLHVYFL